MGCCTSKAFVAPCCRCYQNRIFVRLYDQEIMLQNPKGIPYFARYRLKTSVSEEERLALYRFGYKELFPDDVKRYMYSCERCYDDVGRILPEGWEYSKKGFMRA